MPNRAITQPHEQMSLSFGARSISPTVVLGVLAAVICAFAVRFDDPAQYLGFLAIGISIGTVAALAFTFNSLRSAREAELLSIFDGLFLDSNLMSILTSEQGDILRSNLALKEQSGLAHSNNVSCLLGHLFEEGAAVEYRLRRALEQTSAPVEVVEDRAGQLCRVEVKSFNSDCLIWFITQEINENLALDEIGLSDHLVAVRLHPDGKIAAANGPAQDAGLAVGNELVAEIGAPLVDGALCKLNGAKARSFRCHLFEEAGTFSQAVFVPIDADDLTGASPDQFLDALPVALARVAPDGKLIHLNGSAQQLLGDDAVVGENLNDLLEGLGRSMEERIKDMMQGRVHMRTEVARGKVNGHEIFLQVTLNRVQLDGESSILAVINDATELKTLEAQFVQSQKMQAVGQLAGGVAHDFNNLLTAINGHCDLILMRHETTDTDYGDLIQIRHNANRAASLVGQLLAFSRKQTLLPKVIDLYDTLSDLNHLLNRLLGEKVTLRIEHAEDLPNVRVDERQLEQVIMNLVVNARDAMPNGGEVVIKTMTAVFETDKKVDRVVIPFGTYVQIDVTDTGMGIPEDKITKIFEPFFTTKRVGEGTGLGLSTAYGIIKQTGGFIFAESEVGAGTTFTLYLPTHADETHAAANPETEVREPTDLTGRGVVLLVEDEVPVRSFAARALNIRGYTVLEAGSAEEALEILEDDALEVDVFVSDVIMPGMDGPTWVRMAQEKRPETRVVFVSGYAEDVFDGGQISVPNATFLPKPFSLNELTHTVKEQMAQPLDKT